MNKAKKINPKKVKFYCKNTSCFMHYIANHKLKDTPNTDKTLKGLKEFREKNWDKTLPLNEAYKKYIKIFEDKSNTKNTENKKGVKK